MSAKPPPDRRTPEALAPLVEAALFATADPLSLDALAGLLGAPKRSVKAALERVVSDYAARADGALEIGISQDGFMLQVRPLYQRIVDRLLPSDLPQAELRTLTLVAAREPVLQKDIVEARGSGAYDHIRDLADRGLIHKSPKGSSYELRVGPRFSEYFRLDRHQLDDYLRSLKREAVN